MTSPSGAHSHRERQDVDKAKKTILIYSPDLNFCFSLSMLFQDRYNVFTTTSIGTMNKFAGDYSADLVLIDAVPSAKLIERLDLLKKTKRTIAVIMLYVYSAKEGTLDTSIRSHVDSVFYKPVEMTAVSQRIQDLLAGH